MQLSVKIPIRALMTNELIRTHYRTYGKLKGEMANHIFCSLVAKYGVRMISQFKPFKYSAVYVLRYSPVAHIDLDGLIGMSKNILDVLSVKHDTKNRVGLGIIEDDTNDRLVDTNCYHRRSKETATEIVIIKLNEETAKEVMAMRERDLMSIFGGDE